MAPSARGSPSAKKPESKADYPWEETVVIDVPRRRRRETPYTGILLFSKSKSLECFLILGDSSPRQLASFVQRTIFRGTTTPRVLTSTIPKRELEAITTEWRKAGITPPTTRAISRLNADWSFVKQAEAVYDAAFDLLQENNIPWEEAAGISEGLHNIAQHSYSLKELQQLYGEQLSAQIVETLRQTTHLNTRRNRQRWEEFLHIRAKNSADQQESQEPREQESPPKKPKLEKKTVSSTGDHNNATE